MENTMIARFNDDNIIKAALDRSPFTKISVTVLDEYGEEVTNELSFDMPELAIHLINSSSYDVRFATPIYGSYGIEYHYVELKPNQTADTLSLLGTPDGTNYVCAYEYTPLDSVDIGITPIANCMEYSTFILVLDVNEAASCSIEFTDH